MKRAFVFGLVLGLLLISAYANAACIIKDPFLYNTNGYPDITLNGAAYIKFTANLGGVGGGKLEYYAHDEKITYGPGDFDPLFSDPETYLVMTIDMNGCIIASSMTERVINGVTIKGTVYPADTVLLEGPVAQMKYANIVNRASFGFKIEPISGKLVDDGIWIGPPRPTYIVGYSDITPSSWNDEWWKGGSFRFDKCKADKMPAVPEPGTLMLLGSGLLGMAGYARVRFGRKKKDI